MSTYLHRTLNPTSSPLSFFSSQPTSTTKLPRPSTNENTQNFIPKMSTNKKPPTMPPTPKENWQFPISHPPPLYRCQTPRLEVDLELGNMPPLQRLPARGSQPAVQAPRRMQMRSNTEVVVTVWGPRRRQGSGLGGLICMILSMILVAVGLGVGAYIGANAGREAMGRVMTYGGR